MQANYKRVQHSSCQLYFHSSPNGDKASDRHKDARAQNNFAMWPPVNKGTHKLKLPINIKLNKRTQGSLTYPWPLYSQKALVNNDSKDAL